MACKRPRRDLMSHEMSFEPDQYATQLNKSGTIHGNLWEMVVKRCMRCAHTVAHALPPPKKAGPTSHRALLVTKRVVTDAHADRAIGPDKKEKANKSCPITSNTAHSRSATLLIACTCGQQTLSMEAQSRSNPPLVRSCTHR